MSSAPPALHTYGVFGLGLESYLELPGLRPVEFESPPAIAVRRGTVGEPAGYPPSGIAAWAEPGADGLAWYGRGQIRVSEAAVEVDGEDEPFLRQCVVGPGLGILMHRRGHLVLHGSAIDVGGRAVVLLGQKGAGKSTTAGALLRRGHRLLTDDLVVLTADDEWRVNPGPTQMKLWPASAAALDLDDEVEPFMDGLAKGVWYGASTSDSDVPVGMVCTLAWGDALRADPLTGTEAFGEVFAHAYAPRFLGAASGPRLLAVTARLVQAVASYRFTRPQDLSGLDAAVEAMEAMGS